MSTSTALTAVNNVIANLQDYIGAFFVTIAPVVIGITVLFVGWFVLKGLYHRKP